MCVEIYTAQILLSCQILTLLLLVHSRSLHNHLYQYYFELSLLLVFITDKMSSGTAKDKSHQQPVTYNNNLPMCASVEGFKEVLRKEEEKLNNLCKIWTHHLDEEHGTEETLGMYRTVIGQAKLLMSQRFKQFSELIDNCENNTGKNPVTTNDLQGFWEMIYFQVEDVEQKFKLLDNLFKSEGYDPSM